MAVGSYLVFVFAFALVVVTPGPGLAAILSRTVSDGMRAGFMVVCGLAIVDILFLGIAVVGLSAISVVLGPWFLIAKYVAAIYLVYLGLRMILSNSTTGNHGVRSIRQSSWKDMYLGCIVTLGNPKAIIFYAALLPTLFDVNKIATFEYLVMCLLMTVVTFSVYAMYIFLATLATRNFQAMGTKLVARLSGTSLIGIGVVVAVRE